MRDYGYDHLMTIHDEPSAGVDACIYAYEYYHKEEFMIPEDALGPCCWMFLDCFIIDTVLFTKRSDSLLTFSEFLLPYSL